MSGNARLAPTILLAEDVHGSGFRKLPRNLFREWGFCVLEATHGLEAWHQARKCEGRIDILIAEQNLPFMNGWIFSFVISRSWVRVPRVAPTH
jgi:hypothetical protein